MNTYKCLISFALLLVAIKGGKSEYTPLNETAKCVDGKLVQYANYFVCVCAEGKVHDSELKCVDPVVAPCTKVGDNCADYAKCVSDIGPPQSFKCECLTGYEAKDIAEGKQTCVPKGCKALGDKCGKGLCVKKSDTEIQCACFVGSKLDSTGQKCIDDDKAVDCKLTCTGENFACTLGSKEFYECGCKEGYELKEDKCVEVAVVNKYVPLNEKSVCVNGTLVQYSNHYACVCDEGKVHSSDLKCEEKITDECKDDGKVCGDYASCKTEDAKKVCKCNEGYVFNDEKPAVCVPLGCDKKDTCVDGLCVKIDDTTSTCSCDILKKLDESKNKCEASTDKTKCKLTCVGDNTGCVVENSKYYKCACKEGFELKEGKCVAVENKDPSSAFPASGILNVGLLFLVSSMVYVLV